jgi:hypothetical protein
MTSCTSLGQKASFNTELNMLSIKETTRRRITVTSSLNKISTDQPGNRVKVRGGGVTPLYITSFYSRPLDRLFKGDVNVCSSISDICFMMLPFPAQWSCELDWSQPKGGE